MKKKILTLSLLFIFVSLFAGGTLAYFTATETARNSITAGNISIDLIEKDAEGKPFEDVLGVLPGDEVVKEVTVKNTGSNPCWVRAGVDRKINLTGEGTADLSLLEIDFNTNEWGEADGFFYYSKLLQPGETTVPLFTKVRFRDDMSNIYMGCTAEVKVDAQAVQAANNGSTVLEANGWPAE